MTKYDPVKAHAYYERTKKLKGRQGQRLPPKTGLGSRVVSDQANSSFHVSKSKPTPKSSSSVNSAKQRVVRLKAAVSKLEGALTEARAELSKKRAAAKQSAKENSDGKSTEAEKQASRKYRDKHKTEIATKRKQSSSSSSSSGSSSSSSTSSVSDMSVTELETRIINIQRALKSAKSQLSKASQQLGQLAHSAITSEPMFNEHFARFRSAERRPST